MRERDLTQIYDTTTIPIVKSLNSKIVQLYIILHDCGNTYLYTRSSHYRVVYVYIGRFGIIIIQIWSQIKAVTFDGMNFLLHLSVKSIVTRSRSVSHILAHAITAFCMFIIE